MSGRRALFIIWLATTVVVAGGAWLAYRSLTRVPDLTGRTDPAAIYEEPALIFDDPGILGTAVELRVTEAVRDCMEGRGLSFRGPAPLEDGLIEPDRDGYGIAAGTEVPPPRLGGGGPNASERAAYERALFGAALADGTVSPACADVGIAELGAALGTLTALPYPIEQLEADALSNPAYVESLTAWSACMTERGYDAASPLELIAEQQARLSAARGDEARELAEWERRLAAADFACRRDTIDRAARIVAAELGPVFVERNRAQLEALIPAPDEAPDDLPADLGTGDVQVTLRWSSTVDLDLEVTDPFGAVIDFVTLRSESGGRLDRDANFPCHEATRSPVENIFWPTGGAPSGSYTATVVYRSQCDDSGPQSMELIVRVGGDVAERIRRTIEPGDRFTLEFTR